MKLIVAIVNNEDSATVQRELTSGGFYATKLATTGGFLKTGNTTYLIGVPAEGVDAVLGILAKYSGKRGGTNGYVPTVDAKGNVTVAGGSGTAGGATVFVLGVERFEKF